MSVETMDRAEVTYCYESEGGQVRRLGWAFVRFGSTEERKYIVPVTGGLGITAAGQAPHRQHAEYMPNRPFPYGEAIHYYGDAYI